MAVCGATGRMGRAIARIARNAGGFELIGGIARSSEPTMVIPEEAGPLIASSQVVIDVSRPDFLGRILELHGERLAGRALIVGTTGLQQEQEAALDALARRAAVLVAANFSLGVNLLLELVRRAANALPPSEFDAEIVEAHHRDKVDAPSGTALALANAVTNGRGTELDTQRRDGRSGRTGVRPAGQIGLHAVRGGGVVGEHRVLFLGTRERIELAHAALDRDVFAEGALAAARWLAGRQPGRYTMADVLGAGTGWTTSRSAT